MSAAEQPQPTDELEQEALIPDHEDPLFQDSTDYHAIPLGEDEEHVAASIRAIKWWRRRKEGWEKNGKAQIAFLRERLTKRTEAIEGRIKWHQQALQQWAAATRSKGASTIWGGFSLSKGRTSVQITDAPAFFAWRRQILDEEEAAYGWNGAEYENRARTFLVRTQIEVDKAQVSEWIKNHGGEIPAGIDLVEGDPVLTIR